MQHAIGILLDSIKLRLKQLHKATYSDKWTEYSSTTKCIRTVNVNI